MCTNSHFSTETTHWIKELEMVIQWMVKCLRHLWEGFKCRILMHSMRRLLQRWTKSSIILSSEVSVCWNRRPRSRTVSFAADRLPTWSTITSRSLGTDDSVENYTNLFTIVVRYDDLQEFVSKWDGILSSMTEIPPNDIMEGLYKLGIPKSANLKTVWMKHCIVHHISFKISLLDHFQRFFIAIGFVVHLKQSLLLQRPDQSHAAFRLTPQLLGHTRKT